MSNVLVGALDWQEDLWVATFYPDDLPEDWRLTYYANEFSTTVIDMAGLQDSASSDELAEQVSDCHEGFRPVLRVETTKLSPGDVREFIAEIARHGDEPGLQRLAGVWLAGETFFEMADLLAWRDAIAPGLPIAALIDPGLYEASRTDLSASGISPIVDISGGAVAQVGAWLAIVSLQVPPRDLAARLRSLLESGQAAETICLIATEGYSEIGKLQNLSTVVRLLTG